VALLDTTVLIDLTRRAGHPQRARAEAVTRRLLSAGEPLLTSRINEAEFRVGPLRAADATREAAKVEAVLATLVVLDFDAAAAVRFAEAQAHLLGTGRPAGEMDVLIAAVALANGQSIVTRNPEDFVEIRGLVIEAY